MKLPKLIADLIAAQDKFDSKAFADKFSDDAFVHDEGKTYHGKTEIQQWNELTNSKYKTKYEPLEVKTNGDKIILSAKISGTFPEALQQSYIILKLRMVKLPHYTSNSES